MIFQKIKGVGKKTLSLLNKKIFTILDLLWKLPYGSSDLSRVSNICDLHVGKIQTIKINVIKYNFPRKRNLPNRVSCFDETGKIECVFFNSYEGYIRKILPIGKTVIVSGKISFFRNNYQITNPTHISDDENIILKKHNKYSLSEGLSNKVYNKIIEEVLKNIPNLDEWHDYDTLANFEHITWKNAILKLHDPSNVGKTDTNFYKRLAFDEIFSTMLISSQIRDKIKKIKKDKKSFNNKIQDEISKNLNFKLTTDQNNALIDINNDLKKEKNVQTFTGGCW